MSRWICLFDLKIVCPPQKNIQEIHRNTVLHAAPDKWWLEDDRFLSFWGKRPILGGELLVVGRVLILSLGRVQHLHSLLEEILVSNFRDATQPFPDGCDPIRKSDWNWHGRFQVIHLRRFFAGWLVHLQNGKLYTYRNEVLDIMGTCRFPAHIALERVVVWWNHVIFSLGALPPILKTQSFDVALPETNSKSTWKWMGLEDDPFFLLGASPAYFQGRKCLLLVSGSVSYP